MDEGIQIGTVQKRRGRAVRHGVAGRDADRDGDVRLSDRVNDLAFQHTGGNAHQERAVAMANGSGETGGGLLGSDFQIQTGRTDRLDQFHRGDDSGQLCQGFRRRFGDIGMQGFDPRAEGRFGRNRTVTRHKAERLIGVPQTRNTRCHAGNLAREDSRKVDGLRENLTRRIRRLTRLGVLQEARNLMSKKDDLIPPSPDAEAYAKTSEANAAEIFDREDPFTLFADWLSDAKRKEPNDPNAMALATADENGLPDVRMVLLKDVDARGFVFYTNLESAKGRQLAENSQAALCFHWKSLRRQVRVRGPVEAVSEEEANAYFASRHRDSRIGAWASKQSRPLESRFALEKSVAKEAARFGLGEVPRPPHWSGFRICPLSIEFWRDRPFRLHDRMSFLRPDLGSPWGVERLYP